MLYEKYPDKIKINSAEYAVETDFRLMMRFELCVQKNERNIIPEILAEFYRYNIPPDIDAAVNGMIRFYLCGEEPPQTSGNDPKQAPRRCYAFDEDARYIIAAFRQQYGIGLVDAKMHWFEFSALFAGLTDCTEFVKIMQYRCTDVSKIKNPAEKQRIKRLRQRYALAENRIKRYASVEERNKAMIEETRAKILGRR